MLDEKRWIELNKFPEAISFIRGILEINNVCYVIGNKGISTLNNEVYKFPSNKSYGLCATCRVGDNILVVRRNFFYNHVKSKLFNTINKQLTDVDIIIKREGFAVVYYLNKVFIVGGWDERQALNRSL